MSDKTKETDDLGADQAQAAMDEETDQGYRGVSADPTPLAHYTVAGVNAGKLTPENSAEQAARVAEHQRKLGR